MIGFVLVVYTIFYISLKNIKFWKKIVELAKEKIRYLVKFYYLCKVTGDRWLIFWTTNKVKNPQHPRKTPQVAQNLPSFSRNNQHFIHKHMDIFIWFSWKIMKSSSCCMGCATRPVFGNSLICFSCRNRFPSWKFPEALLLIYAGFPS